MAVLGELIDVISGFAFKSSLFSDEGGLPLIRIRDVKRGFSKTNYIGDYDDAYLINNGDLLVGLDGEFNAKRWSGGKALLNQRVCKIIATSQELDEQYLYHFLPKQLKLIEDVTPSVTVKHLSVKTIRNIEIPLPPLKEQKRIAAILDKADAIRRKRQQAIDLTDQLLRSVFLDMFGDPVTNQKSWVVDKFGNNSSFSQGIQIDTEDQIKSPKVGFSKFLRIVNYTQNTKDFKYIPTPKSRKAFINEDDIVMVRYGATAGFVGGGLEGVLANNLFKIQYDKNIFNREYLFYVLKSEHFYSKLMGKRKGGAMPSISFGVISDMDIQIPPIDIQNEFAKIANYYRKFKEKHNSAFESTKDLFGSLTQQAFSGELYKKIEAA